MNIIFNLFAKRWKELLMATIGRSYLLMKVVEQIMVIKKS